jgi:hypothetical protein
LEPGIAIPVFESRGLGGERSDGLSADWVPDWGDSLCSIIQYHCAGFELAMVMTNIHSDIMEHAAACASQGTYVSDRSHRILLHMMRRLWNVLARERGNLTNAQLVEEFESLADLHARIIAMTKPTLH